MSIFNKKLELPGTGKIVGTGWLPPLPDLRDYTEDQTEIAKMSVKLGLAPGKKAKALPTKVDLRQWCSDIEDQGSLGSCSAHAGMGIVEYFERRAFDNYIDGSRLFLYKTTRNLMGEKGDSGAWLRNVMGALVLCGVPDEKYWPYKVESFDKEPTAFVYAVADNYEVVKYFCHDPLGAKTPVKDVLNNVKKYLAAGIPSMFGFYGFASYTRTDVPGGIPYPCPDEQSEWGHAIAAIGFDDKKKIKNTICNKSTTGALLIRNSWGKDWGEKGYGWLPYDYVLNGLALDFWSLLSMNWVDTKAFGI